MELGIDAARAGKTIREVLQRDLGYSSNLIKKLKFSEGGILVNGEFRTVRYVLCEGDVLSLKVEDSAADVSPYTIAVELPLEVIYEDEWITVVNKPADMPAHPSLGHQKDTVSNALAWRYRDKPYVFRPVNRLDRDTSGCMLTANTRDASYKMYTYMTTGQISKTYLAVLDGVPAEKSGRLTTWMHRVGDSIIKREETTPDMPDAKIALTDYAVLWENGRHAVVMAHPITGRTHQIRVQFAGIGCPVTGDDLYGTASPYITRHALHSYLTCFPHPEDGRHMALTAPLHEDMLALLDAVTGERETILAAAEACCQNAIPLMRKEDPHVDENL
ncbi:MAG: RluA family pseudouridine synthase [Ruminococcaceae bacterium]|nr:RluA family pseudouridine synthase [Oscillospiraceae bacterium]